MALVFTAIAKAQWTAMTGVNGATNYAAPDLRATAGVAVPGNVSDGGSVDRTAHIWCAKNASITFDVWGYSNAIGNWARIDQFTLSDSRSEAQRLEGVGAYNRLQAVVNAIGTNGNATGYWGFSE